jgi:Tfp pilus assembly protein PilO
VTRGRLKLLLGLFGLNLCVFAVYTLPRTLERRNLASRAEVLRSEVAGARARLAALEERQAVIRENTRDTTRFYHSVVKPTDESMLPTIRYVEKAASEFGLTSGNRAWSQAPVKGLGLVRFGTTMPLSGPYRQIVAFLGRLERAPLFIVVDDVQLRARTESGGDLAFHLSTYCRDDSGEVHGT